MINLIKFTIEELSTKDIGDICNVSSTTIERWLIRHQFPTRNRSERALVYNNKKQTKYKDKNWLYEQYILLKKIGTRNCKRF